MMCSESQHPQTTKLDYGPAHKQESDIFDTAQSAYYIVCTWEAKHDSRQSCMKLSSLLAEGQKGRHACGGLRSRQCWDCKTIASITWPLPAFEVDESGYHQWGQED